MKPYIKDSLHGTQVIMGGLHCSDVVQKQFFKEGDVVAYIGNGGFVNPAPTVQDAYAGEHLHLAYILGFYGLMFYAGILGFAK